MHKREDFRRSRSRRNGRNGRNGRPFLDRFGVISAPKCMIFDCFLPGRTSVRNVDLEVANRLFIAKECNCRVNMHSRTIVDASKASKENSLAILVGLRR